MLNLRNLCNIVVIPLSVLGCCEFHDSKAFCGPCDCMDNKTNKADCSHWYGSD